MMGIRELKYALSAVCLIGCAADASGRSEPEPDRCKTLSAADLEGEWRVTATGRRYDCDGALGNGALEVDLDPFRVSTEIAPTPAPDVIETGDEADAFVRRVRTTQVAFTANISDDVDFEGGGGADCEMHFTVRETLSSGSVRTYDFDGEVQEVDRATGTFTGSGPGRCKAKGEFVLWRQ